MIPFTEAMAITIELVLKIASDCDCFMLFVKLFQSRIVFGKKDLENDSYVYS